MRFLGGVLQASALADALSRWTPLCFGGRIPQVAELMAIYSCGSLRTFTPTTGFFVQFVRVRARVRSRSGAQRVDATTVAGNVQRYFTNKFLRFINITIHQSINRREDLVPLPLPQDCHACRLRPA